MAGNLVSPIVAPQPDENHTQEGCWKNSKEQPTQEPSQRE